MRKSDEELLGKLNAYIKEYQRDSGNSPSYRMITQRFATDFSSKAKVNRYLTVLENRGSIYRERNGKIAIDDRLKADVVFAPLVGRVICGEPAEEIANIEENYALPKNMFGSGELFTLTT